MLATKTAKKHEKSTAETSAAKEPSTEREPEAKVITLTYRGRKFVPPDDVHVMKGDTLSFKCSTDLEDAKMVIHLNKKYFRPATFTNGDPPVEVIENIEKGGRYSYDCHFSGTLKGKPAPYDARGGGFVIP